MYKYLLLTLLVACGDGKKEKLDQLYAERDKMKAKIDSASRVVSEITGKYDPTTFDTAYVKQRIYSENNLIVLKKELEKIDFSIDSLSKY